MYDVKIGLRTFQKALEDLHQEVLRRIEESVVSDEG
jgi:hypothetical protein